MKTAMPALLVALTFLFVLAMTLAPQRSLPLQEPRSLFWIDKTSTQDLSAQGAEDEKPDRPFAQPYR
jgi:hypothetical protein